MRSLFVGNGVYRVGALLASLVLVHAAMAEIYYVAPGGDDNAGGTTELTPFATIQKAATLMQAGDMCLVRAGTYRETVTPAQSGTSGSPIVFQAWGEEQVTVSGADPVDSAWSVHSGSIYKTTVTLSSGYNGRMTSNTTLLANQLFAGDEMMPEARWPNLEGTNAADPPFDTLRQSPPSVQGGLTGGICWESSWFISRTGVIQNADATSIDFIKDLCAPREELRVWYTGVLGLLDAEREWHYDPSTTTLYLWAPGGGAPSQVEAKARNFAFDLQGRSHIVIRKIDLFAATIITDQNSSHVVVDNIEARYVSHHATLPVYSPANSDGCDEVASHTDDTGIMLYGDSSAIMNSTITGSSGNGVLSMGRDNVVYNCLIYDCDYMGTYAAPVHILEYPVYIFHSTLYGTGRDGVCWDWHRSEDGMNGPMQNVEIAYNHIYDFGRVQADLAGIYICCGVYMDGTEIHHNYIHSCLAPYWCEDIYFDNGSTGACTYDNDANVRYNLGGSAGDCPNDTVREWAVPEAGCNFAGCGASEGQALPTYEFLPDLSDIADTDQPLSPARAGLTAKVSVSAGVLTIRSADSRRIAIHNPSGRMVAGWDKPVGVLRVRGLARGMYVVSVSDGGRTSRSFSAAVW